MEKLILLTRTASLNWKAEGNCFRSWWTQSSHCRKTGHRSLLSGEHTPLPHRSANLWPNSSHSLWTSTQNPCRKKGYVWLKVRFIQRSIQSIGHSNSKRLHFTPWQTCSFRHQLGFSGKHSSDAAITREDYSLTCPPWYSFKTADWTVASWRERKCPNFEMVAKEDSNLGYLDCESCVLPLHVSKSR